MISYSYRGGNYHLYFNLAALLDFKEKYQDQNLVELISRNDREGLEAAVWLLCQLSRQGELYRRYLGEDPGQVLDYERTLLSLTPAEQPMMQAALMAAVAEGFRREHPEEGADDPWLQEYEAEHSTKKASAGRRFVCFCRRLWASLSRRGSISRPA